MLWRREIWNLLLQLLTVRVTHIFSPESTLMTNALLASFTVHCHFVLPVYWTPEEVEYRVRVQE